ncbi:hypothetical protein [Francisella philomiragia]|uniref:hypothetical protein n=1 Tax=Francisella philomiragia TaxID=28110 RepID=UPI00190801DC|nr:hypothetical protein [Francisella philomiragia]MBK2106433.1 hypothetical protein [Francisella philomiragia]
MYNDLVKKLLAEVNFEDAVILPKQVKYCVIDNFSVVEVYISEEKISFRVYGDAYMLAMIKWLQHKLQHKADIKKISLQELVKEFDLPEFKYRNASQIIELIEKINAAVV